MYYKTPIKRIGELQDRCEGIKGSPALTVPFIIILYFFPQSLSLSFIHLVFLLLSFTNTQILQVQ